PIYNTIGFSPGSILHIAGSSGDLYGLVTAVSSDTLALRDAISGSVELYDNPPTVESMEFDLTVTFDDGDSEIEEKFTQLAVGPQHPRFFTRLIQSQLVSITPIEQAVVLAAFDMLPKEITGTGENLSGGVDDNLTALQYAGGLEPLKKVEGISLLAIPGQTDQNTQSQMIE
ncbi:MAG: hypothetical protein GY940_22970, partial [bacterium]|nr:hypothetical protein [bacterium]